MNRLYPFLLVILIPVFAKAQLNDTSLRVKVGGIAPAFDFSLSKDKVVNLKDYRGKIVMINFFATWCPPCRLELPKVQKEIWEKYKDSPKFALFIFGREEGWDVVLPFKEKNGYTFTIPPDKDRKIYSLYAGQYIPRNIVIDENGNIVYQSIGYTEKDFYELLGVLAARLK